MQTLLEFIPDITLNDLSKKFVLVCEFNGLSEFVERKGNV